MTEIAANLREYLSAGSLLAYPAAFLAGLLISFTPCVYPIIPIQLGFIGGRVAAEASSNDGDTRGAKRRGFKLSMLFVTGMAIVYAALGAFASLTGTLFGVWAASPWTYLIVGNIVLLLALSMLDVFTLPTPQFFTNWNPEKKGKGYVAALLVGASSGLVVGPCTAPALGAVLAYVGSQGSVVFGTTILFTFAFGMGALMIVLGTFGGALLPRSGAWMEKVKKVFGVMMIVVAEYLLLEAGKRLV